MSTPLLTLQLTSKDTANNILQRSIAYANPAKSDYVLKTFTQLLNGLTTNTYQGTTKILKQDITDATEE